MINCFKITKMLYWCVLVPIVLIVVFGLSFLLKNSVFLPLLPGFAVITVGKFVLDRMAQKLYAEKNSVLDENCDAIAYRDLQTEVLSHNVRGLYRVLVQLNLATAYYYCGDFKRMKNTLEETNVVGINERFVAYVYSYYRLWFLYYVTMSNLYEAEKALEKIDSLNLPADEASRKTCEYIIGISHLTMESKKGQVPRIEEKMICLRSSDTRLAIVCEKNFLGKYYLKNGMRDKAKECFEYVAENGNNLFIARAAKELLNEGFNKGEEK